MDKLTANQFRIYLIRADTLRSIAREGEEAIFWTSYLRGLSRHYHGEKSEPEAEADPWRDNEARESASQRRANGEGYRVGLAGEDPLELFHRRDLSRSSTPVVAPSRGRRGKLCLDIGPEDN